MNGGRRGNRRGLRTRAGRSPGQTVRPAHSVSPQPPHAPAFTLIELLVVISVVVLLMALLLAALGRARKQARAVACRAHLRQWATTLALYIEEHEGRLPRTLEPLPGLSMLRGLHLNADTDPNAHRRYHAVRTEDIACCPAATRTTGERAYTAFRSGELYLEVNGGGTFAAWEITRPTPAFRGSYGLNFNIFTVVPPFEGIDSIRGPRKKEYTDVFSLKSRGNIPLLLDATRPSGGMTDERVGPPETEPSGYGRGTCINRHNGTINGLFLDWSVRSIGLKELWTLKWNLDFDTRGPWTKAGGVKPDDWPPWMRQFKDY